MKPVWQRKGGTTWEDPGDCFSCCIASILELDYEEVPLFVASGPDRWRPALIEWLAERGYFYVDLHFDDEAQLMEILPSFGYHIVTGPSSSGNCQHSVVALGADIVHDPNPRQFGLKLGKRIDRFYGVIAKKL